jgi:hypothetical protein
MNGLPAPEKELDGGCRLEAISLKYLLDQSASAHRDCIRRQRWKSAVLWAIGGAVSSADVLGIGRQDG